MSKFESRLKFGLAAVASTLMLAHATGASAAAPDSAPEAGQQPVLQEVIVTAQKREERLQDVPMAVSVVSSDTLVSYNTISLQDYFSQIPGLTDTAQQLAIRGLSTGLGTNPTVGVTIDDVPFGSTSLLGYGQNALDLDPGDLSHIEVLRGPQGVLYGANSLGGLVKYVTVDPSTNGVFGTALASVDGVSNGDRIGYGFRGSVNIPLGDTLAMRVSGFARRDPGYIDNVETNQRGVNWENLDGGHLSVLWKPTEDFSLKLGAILQNSTTHGDNLTDPALGQLKISEMRGTGVYDVSVQAYSAVAKAKFGIVDFTSITGYSVNHFRTIADYTSIFGPLNSLFGFPNAQGSSNITEIRGTKFTQEFRLAMPLGSNVDWLVGLFYNYEDSPETQDIFANDLPTGAQVGTAVDSSDPSTVTDYAAFTNFTVRLTEQFNVQFGARENENRQTYMETFVGPLASVFFGSSPFVNPEEHSKEDSFTYLITPQFKINPDAMVYARVATGFRPGGPNVNATSQNLPETYQADKTVNYEIGFKGDAFDHRVSVDVSAYHIDWQNIQLSLITPQSVSYEANGSRAKSEGVELSVEVKPIDKLSVSGWIAYNDAALTEALPTPTIAYGLPGDQLPYAPKLSGNLAVHDEFPLGQLVSGFVGAQASYQGYRQGDFTSVPSVGAPPAPRQAFGGYAKFDLRTGVKWNSWSVTLFGTNLGDRRAWIYGNPALPGGGIIYLQPRTVGMNVQKDF